MQKIKLRAAILILILLASCTATQLSIPSKFAEASTRNSIKGLTGWMINQKISFGKFKTSVIKRGWNNSYSRTKSQGYSELLNIGMKSAADDAIGKYTFTINNGDKVAEIFCQTSLSTEQTDFIINKWKTTFSNVEKIDYSFAATIFPLTINNSEPWQLLLTRKYDASTDTTKKFKIINIPVALEEGVATDGKDTITIKPIRVNKVTAKNGKDSRMPFRIRMGYELRIDDGVVCIINSYDNDIWMYNGLDESTAFFVGCVASALMLGPLDDN